MLLLVRGELSREFELRKRSTLPDSGRWPIFAWLPRGLCKRTRVRMPERLPILFAERVTERLEDRADDPLFTRTVLELLVELFDLLLLF